MSSVEDDGVISVEGEAVGRIQGLSFIPDASIAGNETRILKAAAVQALAAELAARAKSLSATADTELKLTRLGHIEWQRQAVGRLVAADARYKPRAEVLADDVLNPADREMVRERLQKFADRHLAALLEPLMKLEEAEGIEGITRGIAYRLAESFGVLPREEVSNEVKQLSQEDRAKLRGHGVRFGAFSLFLPALLKPAATDARLLLWWLEKQKSGSVTGEVPAAPANGLTSTPHDAGKPEGFYRMCGYRICGSRVVRVDMLERLSDLIRDRVFWKPRFPEEPRPAGAVEGGGFTVIPDMMSLVGCSGDEFVAILTSLGFRSQTRMLPKMQTPGAKGQAAPAPANEAPVASAVASTDAQPVEASMPEVVEEPVLAVTEAVAEVPPETAPETAPEPASESTPVALPVTGAEAAPAPAAEPVETPELVETQVWWPDGMGPFRPQRHKPETRHREKPEGAKRPHGKPHHQGRGNRGEERDKKQHRKPERANPPPRRERPADPNSPFAVLAAMKAQFEKENN